MKCRFCTSEIPAGTNVCSGCTHMTQQRSAEEIAKEFIGSQCDLAGQSAYCYKHQGNHCPDDEQELVKALKSYAAQEAKPLQERIAELEALLSTEKEVSAENERARARWMNQSHQLQADVKPLVEALECIAGFSDEISSVRVAEKSLEDGRECGCKTTLFEGGASLKLCPKHQPKSKLDA